MNKNIKLVSGFLFLFMFFIVSFLPIMQVQAQDEIKEFEKNKSGFFVPCGNDKTPIVTDSVTQKQSGGGIKNPCDFKYFIKMINKLVNFILFQLAIPISALLFAYAGFLLLFSGGEPGKRTKAKNIFIDVFFGLIIAAACWLIINIILTTLGYDGSWIGF